MACKALYPDRIDSMLLLAEEVMMSHKGVTSCLDLASKPTAKVRMNPTAFLYVSRDEDCQRGQSRWRMLV